MQDNLCLGRDLEASSSGDMTAAKTGIIMQLAIKNTSLVTQNVCLKRRNEVKRCSNDQVYKKEVKNYKRGTLRQEKEE